MRCPVVSCGDEAAALRRELRGVAESGFGCRWCALGSGVRSLCSNGAEERQSGEGEI